MTHSSTHLSEIQGSGLSLSHARQSSTVADKLSLGLTSRLFVIIKTK